MNDACAGSLGEALERPKAQTFMLTALCPVCHHYAEIHPIEPGGADVWRLEMHDRTGRTIRTDDSAGPAADCLVPDACPACDSHLLALTPAGDDVEARCSKCSHRWITGHLNND